jgi:hypothetical protein
MPQINSKVVILSVAERFAKRVVSAESKDLYIRLGRRQHRFLSARAPSEGGPSYREAKGGDVGRCALIRQEG